MAAVERDDFQPGEILVCIDSSGSSLINGGLYEVVPPNHQENYPDMVYLQAPDETVGGWFKHRFIRREYTPVDERELQETKASLLATYKRMG